jgi:hypothetical protein
MEMTSICIKVAIMAMSIPTEESKFPARASFVLFIILIPMMKRTEENKYRSWIVIFIFLFLEHFKHSVRHCIAANYIYGG